MRTNPDKFSVSRRLWSERVHDLPDLRWERVNAARAKIEANMYEPETAVDMCLTRLAVDLDVVVRRDRGHETLDDGPESRPF